MDDFVKQQLQLWHLEDLEETFQKNQIDEVEFNNLEYKDIYDLIPILGLRKKFLRQYEIYKIALNKDNKTDTESEDLNLSSAVSSDSSFVSIPTENHQTSFCGVDDIPRSLGLNFPDFNLKELLESVPYGNSIIEHYKKNNKLDDALRTRLVDIITKHLYNYFVVHRLKHDQYLLICQKIATLLPNEAEAAYYIPYVPKRLSGQKKGILARGRLVDKIRNILFKSGDTIAHKRKSENDESPCPKKAKHQLNETEQDSVTFLNNFREPWEEVLKHWKSTLTIRRNSGLQTVDEFIETWPTFKDLRAEQLINQDFEEIFGQKCSLSLFENWDLFITKIIALEGTSKIRDKAVVQNFSELCEDSSKDTKHYCEINLLCNLLPPKGRVKIGKTENWKFSIRECTESIIKLSQSPGDVEQIVRETKERAAIRQLTVQPYLIVVGPSFKNISSVFLIIDSTIRYQYDSILKAFDTLFKLFHVFNTKYPLQSEHIWTLIQHSIYKLQTKHEKKIPYIMTLLKAFEEH